MYSIIFISISCGSAAGGNFVEIFKLCWLAFCVEYEFAEKNFFGPLSGSVLDFLLKQ
jgi:hypothetical protein